MNGFSRSSFSRGGLGSRTNRLPVGAAWRAPAEDSADLRCGARARDVAAVSEAARACRRACADAAGRGCRAVVRAPAPPPESALTRGTVAGARAGGAAAADAAEEGGSAKAVNRREKRRSHPTVSVTSITGSTIAACVVTRAIQSESVAPPAFDGSSLTRTWSRPNRLSPAATSAETHSGPIRSPGSRRRGTGRSSAWPRTTEPATRPNPMAWASGVVADAAQARISAVALGGMPRGIRPWNWRATLSPILT
jgi:hypothetical protein